MDLNKTLQNLVCTRMEKFKNHKHFQEHMQCDKFKETKISNKQKFEKVNEATKKD